MEKPAISVIIPLYNAEEFIGECLDSILLQTFQDFEVIIVDDCSTDKGVEVVESYRKKFGERLRLARTETNSGGGGYVPRNIGLSLARGEYIFFADADDFLLLTALETLYAAAKDHDADVVYIADYYWLKKPNRIAAQRDLIGDDLLAQGLEDESTLIVDAPEKILSEVLMKKNFRTPWAKLIRRYLLTENNIVFPEIIIGGDALWTFRVYAHAKRFLRLPTPVYFLRRYHATSVVKTKRSVTGYDPALNAGFVAWFREFNALAGEIDFFKDNPDICCLAAKDYFEYFVHRLYEEDKRLCFLNVRDTLLSKMPAESDADLTAPFLELMRDFAASRPLSTCAVSVIISLYNYEKYVGECLDSLLEQTLTDFEVIVVDDCSTDNGVEVVESYMSKFDGRLKLTKTETNSGGGGEPRNIGLSLANGKYVFFMDADDALVPNGLKEMYDLANEFYADVVYCEKYFTSEGVGQEFKDNVRIADIKCQKPPFVDEPTLEVKDMVARINRAVRFKYWVTAWLRLVRRDLLLENGIKFLSLIGSNDVGWSYQVLFCSKRILRVPNAYYIRRVHDASVSFRQREVPEHIHKWMDRTIRSLKYMDDFMKRIEFLKDSPKFRHRVLSHFMDSDFACIADECENLEPFEVAAIFRDKFGDYLGEHDVLVSMLCANVMTKIKHLKQEEQRRNELRSQINGFRSAGAPAVSVIIPMYNAAEFIGECLDSVLEQTLQNFEVIVVDDCSTDNGVEVVESYMERFDGRLKLASTKVNSGGGGYVPRNLGLRLSRGEYVFFLDADDFILLTALERFYDAAKKFDADVVYASAYYDLTAENEVHAVRDRINKIITEDGVAVNEPALVVNDPDKLLQSLLFNRVPMPASWRKFVRRDFLAENDIVFPQVMTGGDFIWTIQLYCHAKRYFRYPRPLYFYRSYNPESVLRKQRPRDEQISYWVAALVAWAKALNKLFDETAILRDNLEYCHRALTLKLDWCLGHLTEELKHLYSTDIYDVLYRGFVKDNDSSELLASFFFSNIVLQRRRTSKIKQRLDETEKTNQQPESEE